MAHYFISWTAGPGLVELGKEFRVALKYLDSDFDSKEIIPTEYVIKSDKNIQQVEEIFVNIVKNHKPRQWVELVVFPLTQPTFKKDISIATWFHRFEAENG